MGSPRRTRTRSSGRGADQPEAEAEAEAEAAPEPEPRQQRAGSSSRRRASDLAAETPEKRLRSSRRARGDQRAADEDADEAEAQAEAEAEDGDEQGSDAAPASGEREQDGADGDKWDDADAEGGRRYPKRQARQPTFFSDEQAQYLAPQPRRRRGSESESDGDDGGAREDVPLEPPAHQRVTRLAERQRALFEQHFVNDEPVDAFASSLRRSARRPKEVQRYEPRDQPQHQHLSAEDDYHRVRSGGGGGSSRKRSGRSGAARRHVGMSDYREDYGRHGRGRPQPYGGESDSDSSSGALQRDRRGREIDALAPINLRDIVGGKAKGAPADVDPVDIDTS